MYKALWGTINAVQYFFVQKGQQDIKIYRIDKIFSDEVLAADDNAILVYVNYMFNFIFSPGKFQIVSDFFMIWAFVLLQKWGPLGYVTIFWGINFAL